MLKLNRSIVAVVLLSLFLSGCTIVKNVSPAVSGPSIETIYVQQNLKVHMGGLHPELVEQLKALGFKVETFVGERPKEAKYWVSYTAHWAWDMAMYLTYFDIRLMEDGTLLGHAEYDARKGGGNMGKFGKTAEKIKPLLTELFQNVKRGPATTASLGKSY